MTDRHRAQTHRDRETQRDGETETETVIETKIETANMDKARAQREERDQEVREHEQRRDDTETRHKRVCNSMFVEVAL